MLRYVAGRLLQAVASLLVIATLVFVLVRLTGDPTTLLVPEYAPAGAQEVLRRQLGLDQPLYVQYWQFLGGLFTLDLGTSFGGASVADQLLTYLPATAALAVVAILGAALVAVPLGILSAVYQGSLVDRAARLLAMLGQSVPVFWLAIMLILFFSVRMGWLPVAGQADPSSYVLPAIAVGWPAAAGIVRLTRSSMLDVLGADYVRMARAKGLSPGVVVAKHALRNALIPVITFSSLLLGTFMNGSVVVETIFAWPGVGRMAFESVTARDFPMVQGAVLMFAAFFILLNLVVDLIYVVVDPRIRYR